MADYTTEALRNFVVVGHSAVGKTTLVEQMLFKAGRTSRLGSVDEKTSVLDYDDEERASRMSITSALANFEWKGRRFNVIDAPGKRDFVAEARGAIPSVETALIVIAAPAGIELNTRRMWQTATEDGRARAIVITKMDGDNILDLPGLIGRIRETFGAACVSLNLPVGIGKNFSGVVSVLDPAAAAPAGIVGDVSEAHGRLMDAVVETNEQLMERYLNEEKISPEEIAGALRAAFAAGNVVPLFHCSGRSGVGVAELLDALAAFGPSPVEMPVRQAKDAKSGEAVELKADPAAPLVAQVFKSVTDPFVGKMNFFRVFSGTFNADSTVYNSRSERTERVGHVFRPFGKENENVESVIAGDIGAVSKIEDIQIGDTLCSAEKPVVLPRLTFPRPMVPLAIMPKSRGDEQKIGQSLTKLASEDPTFQFARDQQTSELVVTGMSQLHVDVMISRLKRRFEVEVETREPKIPYKETVTANGEGSYRHKKQTGGRGQFAEVWLKLEPLPRGTGFEFLDDIVGATIPGQYVPAVEKGVREQMAKGVLAGFPVEDVRVRCFYGKHHPVDSSEQAFKTAAAMCFGDVFRQSRPVLLEPIVIIEITVPAQFMGDVTGDLNSRRGRILGLDTEGDLQVIKAQVPMSEVMKYATQLSSMTGGVGAYSLEFSHYDAVPQRTAEQVIAAAKAAHQAG